MADETEQEQNQDQGQEQGQEQNPDQDTSQIYDYWKVFNEYANSENMSNDIWDGMKKLFPQEVVDLVNQLFDFKHKSEEVSSDESELDSSESQVDSTKGQCSKSIIGVDEYQVSDGQCHKSPETPKYKMEIEENDLPENWWDKLPDFDPRIYDAISMEQAAACVKYIFDDDIHELEHKMEARKFRKTCPKTKVQVPRTCVKKPKEIRYDTMIDDYIRKDVTY